MVPHARPDVGSAYPTYPHYDYGWGLAVLTNMLPNSTSQSGNYGNGTYTLHALAYDPMGAITELPTGQTFGQTIIVDNQDSPTPFGTIDEPGQGGTISGSTYINWGWALTAPGASNKYIPYDGSTIYLVIDGAFVCSGFVYCPMAGGSQDLTNAVHPTQYNLARSDITAAFGGATPPYANLQNGHGAVGYFTVCDHALSILTNNAKPLPSISWTVEDTGQNWGGDRLPLLHS